ncbi:tRNA (adenosine(37)-N6)-dimethylallyltransferase MiaA [Fructilactobacillus cliffordii]|uniref:tRNA (adenosine(37)-N6)-dimethylallyltransferase MiaA n=1 Tax=Fructilactobacillus cliffordii TaxID=2940299 RepID=UPI002093F48B|nr:tRNA (adenosine(37)-N6)-dimethylallyltransferase MiaA [Fructilactobacillus cliffordii]USS86718.1 tRNA (adenosine(37)-N6)-dimethylallyltransferase MiaA [Fructilactobacillus cliffordii]
MKPKVLAVVGPTAVGKSDLALSLAQKFNGEIISGDSMQVYRHLDIGTAKVSPTEQALVPHHLIDILTVQERYGVQQFVSDCQALIVGIHQRGKLPIIAGGTGYYLKALLQGLQLGGHNSSSAEVRSQLEAELAEVGPEELWHQLQLIDAIAAAKIDAHNSRRVMRALEIYRVTGKLPSDQQNHPHPYDAYLIGLNCERSLLYQRINQRVELMMQVGLLSENEWLRKQGPNLPALKGIGYREFTPYFAGEQDLATTVSEIQKDSRHYAKRQLTWFRNQMDVHWYNLVERKEQITEIEQAVQRWRNTDEL